MKRRVLTALALAALASGVTGCENGGSSRAERRLDSLDARLDSLRMRVESLEQAAVDTAAPAPTTPSQP
jgi:hypothetical protein